MEEHTVVSIIGDGVCLFCALSFLMYGTQENVMVVRSQIVRFVIHDWPRFSVITHDRNGHNYSTANEYSADMLKNETCGGFCELVATGLIYPFQFEIYRNGLLYTEFGTDRYLSCKAITIRKYNTCFQTTSFGGKQVTADGFSSTFKVQGQVFYHLGNWKYISRSHDAQYFQIYFVCEDDREAKIRCSKTPN